jgi:hypothetical protein
VPPETGEEGQPLGGLPPAPPSNDNGEGVSLTPEEEGGGESPPETGEEGGQGSENEFEDCIVPPGMDSADVGC